ncbi:MAG: hypothetical protein OEZ14_08065 [Acidimicrobiia bacterium]|nr:hypothetical protein [Acidimicrobiia bacterium]
MLAQQAPPTPAYVDMVPAGLAEAWQLARDRAVRYLNAAVIDVEVLE